MTDSSDPFGRPGPRADLRVAILGAGPVGLDAALAAREAGFALRVYEAAPHPAGHLRRWGHVRLFSPWRMNRSPRMVAALAGTDPLTDIDPEGFPTGHELADRIVDPLWQSPALADDLRTGTRVVAVGRQGTLKHEEIGSTARAGRAFRILLRDDAGHEWTEFADRVLDCTGKFGNPNPLGDGGIPAPGETGLEDRIRRWLPDLEREAEAWAGATVLLVGAGHSAQTAVCALDRLGRDRPGTRVVWAVRGEHAKLGQIEEDPLPGRRALVEEASTLAQRGSPVVEPRLGVMVDALRPAGGRVEVRLRESNGTIRGVEVDRILALTGGVGDAGLYRQLQVHECYATSGPMKLAAALLGSAGGDCLAQGSHGAETLRNPEPGFFILGDKSYGRNNTFLMQVGWSQVDEVVGLLRTDSPPGPAARP